jgi:hypothetical protein
VAAAGEIYLVVSEGTLGEVVRSVRVGGKLV